MNYGITFRDRQQQGSVFVSRCRLPNKLTEKELKALPRMFENDCGDCNPCQDYKPYSRIPLT